MRVTLGRGTDLGNNFTEAAPLSGEAVGLAYSKSVEGCLSGQVLCVDFG